MKSLDDYIEERNRLFLAALSISNTFSDRIWTELGVANRHINRLIKGTLQLNMVRQEMDRCFEKVSGLIEEKKNA